MDETSRDKLSGAMCDFLSDVIRIADDGNYDRDSFVKASAEMFMVLTEISTFEKFKVEDRQVRCKDCEYSCDEISYLCCSHGVYVDCEVSPDFYCAEGKRKETET